ncbi:MAG: T9SS type A sorting domain-containing protein [Bacteroidetes bacterium]|nr:T9SS type A sorting domain-containing protein [Bacteroidota bacterium]
MTPIRLTMNQTTPKLLLLAVLFHCFQSNAQVPILNSNPTAAPTLFLDFDGQTVDNTSWNYAGPIICGGSGLNATQINEIFGRVAQDYSPFTVNVTTDSLKFYAAPADKRMRMIITVTSDWFGAAGGVAFVGSFTWGDDTPCFVFSQLLNFNIKNISEAVSHELGHTLGLFHQSVYDVNCTKVSEYNYGLGSAETGWAPIMGVGYYQNMTQWHSGPNPYGCTNIQNDLDVITNTANGITLKADDHTAVTTTATPITISGSSLTGIGQIEKNDDKDVFKLQLTQAKHTLINIIPGNVGGSNSGSNLDIKAELLNAAGTVIKEYNPTTQLSASVDTILNPGTYYLRISSVGNSYSSGYGSLGTYAISGALVNPTLPLHSLLLSGITDNDKYVMTWKIEADETVATQEIQIMKPGSTVFETLMTHGADIRRAETILREKEGTYFFRLRVSLSDGKTYYSNITSYQHTGNQAKPYTLRYAPGSKDITVIHTSVKASYQLLDFSGRLISKGNLNNGVNTIPAWQLVQGMYIVQLNCDGKLYSEKILR